MKWSFCCPSCFEWHMTDWSKQGKVDVCPKTENIIRIPTPIEQQKAYVDTHDWPAEMEKVVVELKGNVCTIPGCNHFYQTLDHRVPWSSAGKTNVTNLYPVCNYHNELKGDEDYYIWQGTEILV